MKRLIPILLLAACSVYEGEELDSDIDLESSGEPSEPPPDDGPFDIPGAQSGLYDPATDASVVLSPHDPNSPPLEVHPGDTITVNVPFSAPNQNVIGAGIRFGSSGPISVVPVSGAAGQSSGTMQFDVMIPASICADLGQICHDIKCYEFAVTDIGNVSAANIADIALACGDCDEPSCQDLIASCQLDCDSQFVAGGDTPETHEVELGQASGTVDFSYDTYSQEDRMIVSYEGAVLFDSGCVGQQQTVPVTYSGTSTSITVEVQPNCVDPSQSGTSWEFSVTCPT